MEIKDDRPKWRDEKLMMSYFFPIILIGSVAFILPENRRAVLDFPFSVLMMIIWYQLGWLDGHKAGRNTEKLFPNHKPFSFWGWIIKTIKRR